MDRQHRRSEKEPGSAGLVSPRLQSPRAQGAQRGYERTGGRSDRRCKGKSTVCFSFGSLRYGNQLGQELQRNPSVSAAFGGGGDPEPVSRRNRIATSHLPSGLVSTPNVGGKIPYGWPQVYDISYRGEFFSHSRVVHNVRH